MRNVRITHRCYRCGRLFKEVGLVLIYDWMTIAPEYALDEPICFDCVETIQNTLESIFQPIRRKPNATSQTHEG